MKSIIIKSVNKNITCKLMTKHDNEVNNIITKFGMTEKEKEDLLERQRPNILNFDGYSIITLVFPVVKNELISLLQISMIITNKELTVITNENDEILNDAFNQLISLKNYEDISSIISHFIDVIREKSISIFNNYDELLTKVAQSIITGKADKTVLASMQNLRAKLFNVQAALKGNIEVVRELLEGNNKYVKRIHFGKHQDDREVYFMEFIQSLIELTKTNIETYISQVTEKLNNHIYKLTIIGAILIIPTIISGYFGMNVKLPEIGFIEIVLVSIILSAIAYKLVK